MAEVVVGVGTNLGPRLDHLRRGVRSLRALAPRLSDIRVSPIYESDALVPEGAPEEWRRPYLNLAVCGRWDDSPEELLRTLKDLEARLGRRPRERWGPREVDFDLLVFDECVIDTAGLTVPHPGLADRPFALLPLADLAPDWRFPPESGPPPLAGLTAREAARRWTGTPDHVPLRTRRSFLSLTEVVGVVNITPDSFSDGGAYVDPDAALRHARTLVADGATVLDLGAESTRPGATPITVEEEWARLGPVLEQFSLSLFSAFSAKSASSASRGADGGGGDDSPIVSVDTRHVQIALNAITAGARWINDVTGFGDPAMVDAVAEADVDLVLMHSLGIPPDRRRTIPETEDPVAFVLAWADERLTALEARGTGRERVILDPGIGFGKTPDQNAELLRRAGALSALGTRVLVGHSRKSFLAAWYPSGHPAATDPAARDHETALLSAHLARLGVDYVRVHDVAATVRALRAQAFVGSP